MEYFNKEISTFVTDYVTHENRPNVLVGFADIRGVKHIRVIPENLPFAVSIALPMQTSALDDLQSGPTRPYYEEWKAVQTVLIALAGALAQYLCELGFRALPLTHSDEEKEDHGAHWQKSTISHRLIASHAGIGWVGKNGLVITDLYGAAIRLVSVLTDAPVKCSKGNYSSRCSSCKECMTACPTNAIKGANWSPTVDRSMLLDAEACEKECLRWTDERFGIKANVCGTCIVACPYTQSYLRRRTAET